MQLVIRALFAAVVVVPTASCGQDDGSSGYSDNAFSCHLKAKPSISSLFDTKFVSTSLSDASSYVVSFVVATHEAKDEYAATSFLRNEGLLDERTRIEIQSGFSSGNFSSAQRAFALALGNDLKYSTYIDVKLSRGGRDGTLRAACGITRGGTVLLYPR